MQHLRSVFVCDLSKCVYVEIYVIFWIKLFVFKGHCTQWKKYAMVFKMHEIIYTLIIFVKRIQHVPKVQIMKNKLFVIVSVALISLMLLE